ncbi:MAG: hypothetical protein WCI53_01440 [Bacteroidota bacterium]
MRRILIIDDEEKLRILLARIISKEFVEAQGGSIKVESTEGIGSSFTVTLNKA